MRTVVLFRSADDGFQCRQIAVDVGDNGDAHDVVASGTNTG